MTRSTLRVFQYVCDKNGHLVSAPYPLQECPVGYCHSALQERWGKKEKKAS